MSAVPSETRRYTIFQAPVLAFYSRAFYREAARLWRGTGFLYLFALLAVCWIPVVGSIHSRLEAFAERELPVYLPQIPDMKIENGVLSVDAEQPHEIRRPSDGKPVVVIDTTGTIRSLDETEAPVLVTRTHVSYRINPRETRSTAFSQDEALSITSADVERWAHAGLKLLIPVLYPVFLGSSYAARILLALIYAGIGSLAVSKSRTPLGFQAMLRLAVVAMTPAILLKTALSVIGYELPLGGVWYFLIALNYLFFGIRSAGVRWGPPPVRPPS